MIRHGIAAVITGVSLLLNACGGGGGGTPPPSNSGGPLAVTASASAASTTTLGPAYVVDTLKAQAANGTPPYTYSWSAQGRAHGTLSSATATAPSLAATLGWGDSFNDTWQVTVTDAANHAASATVNVSIAAPPADGMPAGFTTTPIRGSIVTDSVASAVLPGAGSYPLAIYLPADYASTSDSLPVIYATDGVADLSDPTQYNGWQVPDMARILEAKGKRAIIVGIGGYERRNTDYLLPGATAFYSFVTTELIPYIEKKYRASPNGRTLSGHSYGGLFTGLAMMMDRPSQRYFSNFISLDGSYFDQADLTASMEQTLRSGSGGGLPNTLLVLTSSSAGNDAYVDTFYQQLQALDIQGWQVTRVPNYNTGHLQMFDEGFTASVDIVFKLSAGL